MQDCQCQQPSATRRPHSLGVLGLLAGLFLLVGCATTGSKHQLPLTGDLMIDGPNAITNGPPRDKVLWQYRTALAAMRRGYYDMAARYLDEALDRIEGVLGYDPEARKARGYFTAEAKKTFIGEPYERVMAYYYRGILFWMDGDYANARACFRSAQLQDADTVEHTYASDYILLDYLDGYCTVKLGGDATSLLHQARQASPQATLPDHNPNANVIFFLDYGLAPIKYATGQYGQELRFRPRTSPVRSAQLRIGEQTIAVPPTDDLYYQATTRGGRVMDHILGNKAVFKASTDTAGNAALISGMVLAGNRDHAEVGWGLIAAGLLAKALSASTAPEADIRSWDNLPLYLGFAALELPPGEHSVTVEFLGERGAPLPQYSKTVHITATSPPPDTVVYLSDQSTPHNL